MHLNITDTFLLPLKQQQLENLLKKKKRKEKKSTKNAIILTPFIDLHYCMEWSADITAVWALPDSTDV